MLIFSLIMTLMLTLTMILFGLVFQKKPPENINSLYGYRTRMSSKNQETWDFAHEYSGRVWLRTGSFLLIGSMVLIFLLRNTKDYEKYMMTLFYFQMGLMLMVIPVTERALRKSFDKEGNRLLKENRNNH
jgi:uncharacterized membrane protein